jgi:hypothetical protein
LDGSYCPVTIHGVRHCPDINVNLLLLGTFLRKEGMSVSGLSDQMVLRLHSKPYLVFTPTKPGATLFGVNSEFLPCDMAQAAPTLDEINYDTMHCCFAHPSHDVLKHACKHTANFPSMHDHKPTGICAGCAQGKLPNQSYTQNEKRASVPFEIVRSDLKSYPVNSYHNHKYIITFFDDHTSHAWVKLLKSKDQAINAVRQFLKMVQTQHKAQVLKFMSDGGGEYQSKAFHRMLSDQGIELLLSPLRTPQVNGRAEHFMRTLTEKADAKRHTLGIPDSWWEFAVEHAVHVYNRTPLRHIGWKTPFELVHKELPNIDHLCVFGCGAYIFIPSKAEDSKKRHPLHKQWHDNAGSTTTTVTPPPHFFQLL